MVPRPAIVAVTRPVVESVKPPPVIDHAKCIASVKNRPACYLCWLYCPEGIVKAGIPIEIDLTYCKGCGICAKECPEQAIAMASEEKE